MPDVVGGWPVVVLGEGKGEAMTEPTRRWDADGRDVTDLPGLWGEEYESCMSLSVSEDGDDVELCLNTSVATYSEWIKGEGGDIGLLRSMDTHRVMGVRLPLYRNNLVVHHEGPIRINAGFRKGERK